MACFFFLLLLLAAILAAWYLIRRRRLPGGALLILPGLPLALLVLYGFSRARHGAPPASDALPLLFIILLAGAVVALVIRSFRRDHGDRPAPARRPSCPPMKLLKDFLAERTTPREHARLAAHLEVCAACQYRLEGLTALQESWSGLARELGPQGPSTGPALRQVIQKLKGEKEQEPTRDAPAFET